VEFASHGRPILEIDDALRTVRWFITSEASMNIDIAGVNWFAVLTAGIVTFFIGGAWYTALFGKAWVAASGYSEEQMAKMQNERPMPVFFGTLVVCYIVIAFFVALLVQATGVKTAGQGAVLGILLWLVAAPLVMTGHISGPKKWGAYLIDVSYQLVYLVLMGALLAWWR
jgi:hypothetical protein